MVWWDPSALNLGVEAPFGLRRQELIARDVAPEVVAAGQRAYIGWRDARDEAVKAGTQPSVRVRTATEWAMGSGSDMLRRLSGRRRRPVAAAPTCGYLAAYGVMPAAR